ncbi:energy transducer TonB [Parerythrobacter aestuarii]|uniref:energy transducer TonB n=1 Tax=Parerythrobacter aestuarii TaxID=3020909 RepID=UPI0024DE8A03|nr:energy transducer TonB [Parerythrobacter aestuarii]
MAYADQQMSGNRVVAIIIVALLHVAIGYVLVTGLAYEAAKNIVERVTTIDVEEPEPEEEPPPPPEEIPETAPPPVVVPPAPIQFESPNIIRDTTREIIDRPAQPERVVTQTCADGRTIPASASCGPATKTCPGGQVVPVNAQCPAFVQPKNPTPRGNPGRWVTTNDYPSRSLREEEEGVTSVALSVDANGRVTGCRVTGSSGHPRLDEATCKNMQRRARFNPATDSSGRDVAGTYTQSVRWEIPQ